MGIREPASELTLTRCPDGMTRCQVPKPGSPELRSTQRIQHVFWKISEAISGSLSKGMSEFLVTGFRAQTAGTRLISPTTLLTITTPSAN